MSRTAQLCSRRRSSECSMLWHCLHVPAAVIEALLRNVCRGPSSGLKGLQTNVPINASGHPQAKEAHLSYEKARAQRET